MTHVSFAKTMHAEQINNSSASANGKSQGTLKTDSKSHSIYAYSPSETESITEDASEFLQEINQQDPEEMLQKHEFSQITQEDIEVEEEIADLLQELDTESEQEDSPIKDSGLRSFDTLKSRASKQESKLQPSNKQTQRASLQKEVQSPPKTIYSSLFSLASTVNSKLNLTKQQKESEQNSRQMRSEKPEGKSSFALLSSTNERNSSQAENKFDREGNGKQDQEKEQKQNKDQEQKEQEDDQEGLAQFEQKLGNSLFGKDTKKVSAITNLQAAKERPSEKRRFAQASTTSEPPPTQSGNSGQAQIGSMENIYVRFMALMARILGQAEWEAHQLYLRIKERTDNIDALTLLLSKINSEKGAIDWSKNEEMKQLIEKARALGVEIPEGKLKWTDDEKKLLKENVQLRKDSMEKITQLERTDMQRYLQEASQCHQARSNVLKILKEVIDTIIHNFRPS